MLTRLTARAALISRAFRIGPANSGFITSPVHLGSAEKNDGVPVGCIEGYVKGCMEGCIDGYAFGCMDGSADGCELGCIDGWTNGCKPGCIVGCVEG